MFVVGMGRGMWASGESHFARLTCWTVGIVQLLSGYSGENIMNGDHIWKVK